MDWPQHDEFDFDCDFDESFDVNFKIPGPPLDIFNTSPQRDRGVGPVSRTFPRPPVAPIRFKNLKSSLSSALEERQSAPTFPSPGRVYEPKARTFHHTFKTAPSLPVNQERPANSNLVSVMQLSNPKFEKLFNFKFFNKIQSQSFDDLYLSDRNIVLSAPTGGGKTVVMELAMLRMFSKKINDAKVIYIAPTKALCEERQVVPDVNLSEIGKNDSACWVSLVNH